MRGVFFSRTTNFINVFPPCMQVKQEFYKYPKPLYNFNYVDQLISGDQEELWDFTKYRRLLFNIVPPKVRQFPSFFLSLEDVSSSL